MNTQSLSETWLRLALVFGTLVSAGAAPVIDPISNVNLPAGKSLTLPITASSPNGRPLTYTVTSSTNPITVEVHTNNPFWRMSIARIAPPGSPGAYSSTFRGADVLVTNVGDMLFMLFQDRAPRTVDAFTGFSHAELYSRNTIFHRVIPGFMIQGGDPATNGTGGPVFRFDDEFHPRAIFSGNGQLAMANSGKDSNGSQFFVTFGTARHLDFKHTIFGQLLRGFEVQTNIVNTPRNASDRPLRDVIIQRANIVTNITDTVLTLTGTNLPGVSGTIRVIADDGAGGRTTNTFTATTAADAHNAPPFLYPNTITNLAAPVNGRLTNFISAFDLENSTRFFEAYFWDASAQSNSLNSDFSVTFTTGKFVVVPNLNYAGPLRYYVAVSQDPLFSSFDIQQITFAIGDTLIGAIATNFVAQSLVPFTNQLLATFTNGLPTSAPGNFTASINWGDNSTNVATIVTNASGLNEVRGNHTFTNAGHYPVQITIRSTLGAQAMVTATAIVPPALSFSRWGDSNRLQWPSWAAGYQVQSHTNLTMPDWLTLTDLPFHNTYETVITNVTTTSNTFFRLKK